MLPKIRQDTTRQAPHHSLDTVTPAKAGAHSLSTFTPLRADAFTAAPGPVTNRTTKDGLASFAPRRHITGMTLEITQSACSAMLLAARNAAPHEACGLLLGTASCIHSACPTANVASDPAGHFEIDPAALIAAHRKARDGSGPDVVGYFHSHPNGLDRPSATDAQSAAGDGRVWVIVADETITCWTDGPKGFEALSYAVTHG